MGTLADRHPHQVSAASVGTSILGTALMQFHSLLLEIEKVLSGLCPEETALPRSAIMVIPSMPKKVRTSSSISGDMVSSM